MPEAIEYCDICHRARTEHEFDLFCGQTFVPQPETFPKPPSSEQLLLLELGEARRERDSLAVELTLVALERHNALAECERLRNELALARSLAQNPLVRPEDVGEVVA